MTRARPAAGGGRQLRVAPERLGRWLDGVADRHGPVEGARVEGTRVDRARADGVTDSRDDPLALRLVYADTTEVVLRPAFAWEPQAPLLTSFAVAARRPHRSAVLLVRRGRWAVGVFDGPDLVVSKVDARQVQGRTAAGGWSQQRFARRRGHQADAVVAAAAATAARVLLPHAAGTEALFTGGDRGLADDVLTDPRLRPLAALRRGPALEVGEPTKAVLLGTVEQFRAVAVHITEPADRR